MAQVAVAWTLPRRGVASTLIGASNVSQLANNIAVANLRLNGEQMKRLNEASEPTPVFSSSLVAPLIRRMVLGGHDVVGWGE
jgi:aryl-alcohol dehydrogenase-like predicted oxidoreductase